MKAVPPPPKSSIIVHFTIFFFGENKVFASLYATLLIILFEGSSKIIVNVESQGIPQ